jgi:hypothetical protein
VEWTKNGDFKRIQQYEARKVGKVVRISGCVVDRLVDAVDAAFVTGGDFAADTWS